MQPSKILFVLGLSAYATSPANAQSIGPSAITTAGRSSISAGVAYDYAIGQLTSAGTYTSASLIVLPGVLQPEFTPTGVARHSLTPTEVRVYPNPVLTTLHVQPRFTGAGTISYKLHDAAGRLVLQSSARLATGSELQNIQMTALPAAQYTLQVEWLQGGQISGGTYQVQKLD